MANTALVTGASSGIGAEFARYHAQQGGDVVLTARSADKLNALANELSSKYNVKTSVFAVDLGADGGAADLVRQVTASGLQIDVLINNAGFGGRGRVVDREVSDEMEMIDLNVKSLVALSHYFGGEMAKRGRGHILNVGSTAGFMPGPLQATYFATKAFVQSFSQALDHELRPQGVNVTLLAPGYVKTAFADRADLHGTKLVADGGKSPASVAKCGYDAMLSGKLVVVNEAPLGFMINWIIPLLPRRTVMKMIEKMQTK